MALRWLIYNLWAVNLAFTGKETVRSWELRKPHHLGLVTLSRDLHCQARPDPHLWLLDQLDHLSINGVVGTDR